MKVFFSLKDLPYGLVSAVAIGVFDGLHRGHRRLLTALCKTAKKNSLPAVVLTFYPHPRGKPQIISLSHRLKILEDLGIDICIVLRPTLSLLRRQPEDFIKDILVKRLGARYVYVGENFRFGRERKADVFFLRELSKRYGFRVRVVPLFRYQSRPLSSSILRVLIQEGRLDLVRRLLARPLSILGKVIRGKGIGKKLGFPTANLSCQQEVLPPAGVYAVKIKLNKKEFNGVCYVGKKKTVTDTDKLHIEVNIFDFSEKIYGEEIEVEFIAFLRPDKHFSSLLALQGQIKKDAEEARRLLSSGHHK